MSRRAGLIAAAMCWITPGALLVLSITAYPAYASGMLVTTARLPGGIRRRRRTVTDPTNDGAVRRDRRVRVLAAPDVPRDPGADGGVRAVDRPASRRWLALRDRRRDPRLSAAAAVERRQLVPLARDTGEGPRHVHRATAHVRRRSVAPRVRPAGLRSELVPRPARADRVPGVDRRRRVRARHDRAATRPLAVGTSCSSYSSACSR